MAVKSCKEVPLVFHPRYDCKSKRYLYRIWNSQAKNPFLKNYAWHYKSKLDADILNEQAKQFIGTHDFAGFCSSGSSVEDTVRTIYDCGVVRNGDEVDFYVEGNGFLYNMVRIMVGSLIEISEKRIEKDTLTAIIESRDREKAGRTAPACGLFLDYVSYGEAEV